MKGIMCDHHYIVMEFANANGQQFSNRCRHCHRLANPNAAWMTLAAARQLVPIGPFLASDVGMVRGACERYGAIGPVERHHWAPSAIFDDSDSWPTADLCGPCHRRWHAMMRRDQKPAQTDAPKGKR
jgi:hypothetical protein